VVEQAGAELRDDGRRGPVGGDVRGPAQHRAGQHHAEQQDQRQRKLVEPGSAQERSGDRFREQPSLRDHHSAEDAPIAPSSTTSPRAAGACRSSCGSRALILAR
jgi:hypothetical protein